VSTLITKPSDECRILGNDLAVELFTSKDIYSWLKDDPSLPYYFGLELNLCQPISHHSVVGQKCGSVAELQLQQPVDACESDKQKRDQDKLLPYCWYIHQNSHPARRLVNDSNPSLGAWILFGNLSCCPKNDVNLSDPETTVHAPIWIKLVPPINNEKCSDLDYFEVNITETSDFKSIYSCPAHHEIFQISLSTSRLCPENINYVLNATQSSLDCSVDERNSIVTCTVTFPSSEDSHVWFLNNFEVELTRNATVTSYLLPELAANCSTLMPPVSHDHWCKFSLPAHELEKVAVKYSLQPFRSSENIRHSPCDVLSSSDNCNFETVLIIAIAVGGVAIGIIAVVVYCVCRHKSSSSGNSANNPNLQESYTGSHESTAHGSSQHDQPTPQNDSNPNCSVSGLRTDVRNAYASEEISRSNRRLVCDVSVLIRGELVCIEKKHDACVICHRDDAKWVDDNLQPLFDELRLSVVDCHTLQDEEEFGQVLTNLIVKRIRRSSCYIIICSPENQQRVKDYLYKYAQAQALHQQIESEEGKLLIISTNDDADIVPETLKIFTHIKWNDVNNRGQLREKLLSVKKMKDKEIQQREDLLL
jgi:hypothetical protein